MVNWGVLVLFKSSVTWKASVVGVVDFFGVSECNWIVESIQLIIRLIDVVLNTISILVINFSLLKASKTSELVLLSALSLGLEESDFCILNWSVKRIGRGASKEGSQYKER